MTIHTVLTQSCTTLPGIGSALANKLAKCGIQTIQDLIFHLPYRYQNRTQITPICDLRADDWCVVAGQICYIEVKSGKRPLLYCTLQDKTGTLTLKFFHFNQHQVKALQTRPHMRVFGEVRMQLNHYEMVHPEYHILDPNGCCPVEEALTPIYSSTQGLHQTRIRQLINTALKYSSQTLTTLEWLDNIELRQLNFPSIADALHYIHSPPPDVAIDALLIGTHPALQRLAFDELIAQRVSLQLARKERAKFKSPTLPVTDILTKQFLSTLPFQLTNAQLRVTKEVKNDLIQTTPMLRLVQGDVGSGKTVIAALAALQAIANNYQVAFMAPTDLLSEQHANNLQNWFAPLNINVERLSGQMTIGAKRAALKALSNHECHLIVGTHALFQNKVQFAKLGLVIIDEQHRFGVEQRVELHKKGQTADTIPHQLLMTATPIPRTLAMTHFAHLEVSIIDELPPGRTPIVTTIINQAKRELLIERLKSAMSDGRQAYWVCTLIDESEKITCIAATETAQQLQLQLPNARVGLIHGRMKNSEKEATMLAFKQGAIDLLVATTVIEVGVDVPKASLMMIENAERLGLSQLHQLRGRVGRGSTNSYCLLLYQPPLSNISAERLQIMKTTQDGFIIAEKDLALRGSGELLGTKQAGYHNYKIAKLQRDQTLLPAVASMANKLLSQNPSMANTIMSRWLGNCEMFLCG